MAVLNSVPCSNYNPFKKEGCKNQVTVVGHSLFAECHECRAEKRVKETMEKLSQLEPLTDK